jgi:hypothetical protein
MMSSGFTWAVRSLPLAVNRRGPQACNVICCAGKSLYLNFPHEIAKVAVISVDTAGREVPLTGQEGICVQWL